MEKEIVIMDKIEKIDLEGMRDFLLEKPIDLNKASNDEKVKNFVSLTLDYSERKKIIYIMNNIFELSHIGLLESTRTLLFTDGGAVITMVFEENAEEDTFIEDFSITVGTFHFDLYYIEDSIDKNIVELEILPWRRNFEKYLNDKIAKWEKRQEKNYIPLTLDTVSLALANLITEEVVFDELMITLPIKDVCQVRKTGTEFQIVVNEDIENIDTIPNEVSLNKIWEVVLPMIKNAETKEDIKDNLEDAIKGILGGM